MLENFDSLEKIMNMFIYIDLLDEKEAYYDMMIDILFTYFKPEDKSIIVSTKLNLEGSYKITDKQQIGYVLDKYLDYCLENEYYETCDKIKIIKEQTI
jgi:hypothetical protein